MQIHGRYPRRIAMTLALVLLVIGAHGLSAAAARSQGRRGKRHKTQKLAMASEAALLTQLSKRSKGLRRSVLKLGLRAFQCAWKRPRRGALRRLRKPLLTIVDYSLPSNQKRLWVFDLRRRRLLFYEHVAHGKNTGARWARRFSNRNQSKQSSLGLFVTGKTYRGSNGFSLRLDGVERGFNHNARRRAIVMHGAWYVSRSFLKRHGRLGRSWGCPAVRKTVARRLLNRIKRGSALFIYYPQRKWLRRSTFLRCRRS